MEAENDPQQNALELAHERAVSCPSQTVQAPPRAPTPVRKTRVLAYSAEAAARYAACIPPFAGTSPGPGSIARRLLPTKNDASVEYRIKSGQRPHPSVESRTASQSVAHAIPVVMAFAGHDPTGGAGVQADVEALASMGCHAAPVITALTVQDTRNVMSVTPVDTALLVEQARAVLEDMRVSAFKIGLLGSVTTVEAIHTLLRDYPDIPVVLDPVLRAGGGTSLADEDIVAAMHALLFPLTTVLTPNSVEARLLAPEADDLDACAQELMDAGCKYVLVTGSHEATAAVINRLYGNRRLLDTFTWERLAQTYHGSGCTLAAALAGLLAHGMEPCTAALEAQEYTWETLKQGYRPGMGQWVPNRLFWAVYDEGLGS